MSCGYTGGCGYTRGRYTGGCGSILACGYLGNGLYDHDYIRRKQDKKATTKYKSSYVGNMQAKEDRYVLIDMVYIDNVTKAKIYDVKTNQIFTYGAKELVYILHLQHICVAGINFDEKCEKLEINKKDAIDFVRRHNLGFKLNY